jgi:GNAT superfamily N-acetyltransferase
MAIALHIVPLTALRPDVNGLRAEALGDSFQFIEKLITDWESGFNKFDQPGECLLGAFSGADLVGVGGLNRDPYVRGGTTGRIRHLYVRRSIRGQGVGSALLRRLLDEANATFDLVRLRTDRREAAAFYLGHGFFPVTDAYASHAKVIRETLPR